jgi:hypothetical protein
MQSIASVDALHEAIAVLESRRLTQEQELSSSFQEISESLKPINMIKTIVQGFAGARGIQHQMVNASLGLVAGYLFRKLFIGAQAGPFKKILGAVLQFGITSLVGKNGDTIKAGGSQFMRSILDNGNGFA